MNEQVASAIRTILKLAAGYLAAKGIGDIDSWELIAAGITAAIGVYLSWRAHNAND